MSSRHVVLDACVLYPEWLRDLFLRCAEANLFTFRWTDQILDEVVRNVGKDRALTSQQTGRLTNAIRNAFEEGEVADYQQLEAKTQNHPKDRHVVAAAMKVIEEGFEATIVTANLKDFAPSTIPTEIIVMGPDEFLLELLDGNQAALVDIIWAHAQRRKAPPVCVEDLLAGLAKLVPIFISKINPIMNVRTEEQLALMRQRLASARKKSVEEFLAAFQDFTFADSKYAEAVNEHLTRDNTVAKFVLRSLRDPRWQLATLNVLRSWGISLGVDRLLTMTVEEIELILENVGDATH